MLDRSDGFSRIQNIKKIKYKLFIMSVSTITLSRDHICNSAAYYVVCVCVLLNNI